MEERILEEIGLTKGETRVYLTLLNLGETTTGKIIEEAQISAGKVYQILDKLAKKGLVGFIIKKKTKYFSAIHPNRIIDLLHEKEEKLKNKEAEIKKILPSLINTYKFKRKNHETTLFQGLKGIQTAIFEFLERINPKEEILAMGITTSKEERFNILWEKWHGERVKKGIRCSCLFYKIKTTYKPDIKKMKFTEIKVLEGITPSAITISEDYVLIQTYEEEVSCLLIKNENIAKSFKTFFETLWKIAKP